MHIKRSLHPLLKELASFFFVRVLPPVDKSRKHTTGQSKTKSARLGLLSSGEYSLNITRTLLKRARTLSDTGPDSTDD